MFGVGLFEPAECARFLSARPPKRGVTRKSIRFHGECLVELFGTASGVVGAKLFDELHEREPRLAGHVEGVHCGPGNGDGNGVYVA